MPYSFGKNLKPGRLKGVKARRSRGRLLPAAITGAAGNGSWFRPGTWYRDMERVPGADRSWYRPPSARPRRRERRGQAKPR